MGWRGGSAAAGRGLDPDGACVVWCGCAGPVFYYEVHPRDSLGRIAALFGVGVCTLRHDNRALFGPGEKGGVLPGMWLKIRNQDAKGTPALEQEGRGLAVSLSSHPPFCGGTAGV